MTDREIEDVEIAKSYGFDSEVLVNGILQHTKGNEVIWYGARNQYTRATLLRGSYIDHHFYPTLEDALEVE